MSLARVRYSGLPVQRHRVNVCGWLARHGIDPKAVHVPGWIGWDTEARQISYTTREPLVDALPEVVVVQLESPPLPFPVMLADQTYVGFCPDDCL